MQHHGGDGESWPTFLVPAKDEKTVAKWEAVSGAQMKKNKKLYVINRKKSSGKQAQVHPCSENFSKIILRRSAELARTPSDGRKTWPMRSA